MREEQVAAFAGAGQEEEEEAEQYDPPEPAEAGTDDATVTVTRAVDGDTIEISPAVDGIEDVRLIGVDAPETSGDCGEEPYAEAAASYAASWEGTEIELELGEERTDRYGRLLAYVHDPFLGTMMNEELLRSGHAQLWIIPPNDEHEDELRVAQEEARSIGLGIWGLPPTEQEELADHGNGIGGGVCAEQYEVPQYEAPQEEQASPAPNPSPSAPAGGDLDCADFGTSAEAQAYLLPGDPHGLDADGDGQACDSLP
jgi:micrococcal nuclease